jgi:enoyl-CoA hydratase/carnithine racemase
MDYSTIRVTRDDGLPELVTITLARPDKLNAIDYAMHGELQAACADLRADTSTRVVMLTGEGRAFSSGNDLRPAKQPRAKDDLERRYRVSAGNRSAEAVESLPQVTIAVVNGLAVGGAVVLAACCDIRVAAETAWFSIPEVDLGLPLTWNALPRIMREIGPARTRELVMTCDRFTAQDAERWGFVNHVYADGDLMPQARALAEKLLAKPAVALALTKATTAAIAAQMAPAAATTHDPDLLLLVDMLARRKAEQ